MFCKCGCGRVTTIAHQNDPRSGIVKGQHRHFVSGHNQSGRNKNGGFHFDRTKQRWYVIGRGGTRNAYYRIVMQNVVGRELLVTEDVHHINGDSTDDRVENLELVRHSDHIREHYFERQRDERGRLLAV